MNRAILISGIAIGVIFYGAFFLVSHRNSVPQNEPSPSPLQEEPLPVPSSLPSPIPASPSVKPPTESDRPLPAAVNLTVPFTIQAPHANWSPPYNEFCEEASVFMAMSYILHESIPSPEIADEKLAAIQTFEDKTFGSYEDTTAKETLSIIHDFYTYPHAKLLKNPTVEDIKKAVAAGKLVIVPAAGRELGNPFFTPPGPIYHMVVIKGYTADNTFITNDPGTRRGADFVYDQSVLMNAIHDWRSDGNINLGQKVVIIVG